MKIDILLPIYNSPKETRECIESIIKTTAEEMYNLYLLDDCSTDPEIMNITDYYSNKYNNILVYRNEFNKGFPENVNNGFRITGDNDVVILNSDTIVTNGWLKGLYLASKSQPKVAAVGPLSNYGMVSSIPTIYQHVNDSINLLTISNYIKSIKASYPETPILVGFCMYIPRKAINEVGLLDAKTFKKGYGEETDWCLRAREKGYKLIIADNIYVFHVGGVSFGEEKKILQDNAAKIIKRRYPNYMYELQKFEINHPLTSLRKKMSKELEVPYKYRIRSYLREKKSLLKSYL